MKIVWNILLGICTGVCAAMLILQGFGIPALGSTVVILLRMVGAFCLQWLFLRLFRKKLLQAIPALAAGCWTCWGYFLYLTSPAWRKVTFGAFLADNASYLGGCLLLLALAWLLPRLIPRIRKAIRRRMRKRRIAREHNRK